MKLIKIIHYTYSISEFYLNPEKGDIIELKHLQDGRIKKYKLSKEDNRLTTLKQLRVREDQEIKGLDLSQHGESL